MSYCVNCGVKLAKSEKKCPLCNTKVINPNLSNDIFEPAYPCIVEKYQIINFKFILKLTLLLAVMISLIFVFCDFILSKSITWSIYAVSIVMYLSCHLSYIVIKNAYVSQSIVFLGTELFIFVIAYLNNGLDWYKYLVLPFLFVAWLYIMLCIFFFKKNKKGLLRKFSICFLFSSLAIIVVESCIDLYHVQSINLGWSLYAALPIIVIGSILFGISFNKKLIDEIKQRIFI